MPKNISSSATENAKKKFISTLLGFDYIGDEQIKPQMKTAAKYARKIPAFSSWPQDAKQFWNAESFCWDDRITKEVRDSIHAEVSHLQGKNLDLGAGSVCYLPQSVAVDFSEEMLGHNPVQQKVVANLEEKLPFADKSFDSATLFFVSNYIQNIHQLLQEAHRLLRLQGCLVIVQASSVSLLHRQHYKNTFGREELHTVLEEIGFKVESKHKAIQGKKLIFMNAQKK